MTQKLFSLITVLDLREIRARKYLGGVGKDARYADDETKLPVYELVFPGFSFVYREKPPFSKGQTIKLSLESIE